MKHRMQSLLEEADMLSSGKALHTPEGWLFGWGTTPPVDAVADGYAPGAHFFHTDGTTVDTMVFVNRGSKTSNNFDPLNVDFKTNGGTIAGAVTISGATVLSALVTMAAGGLLTGGAATPAAILRSGKTITEGWELKVLDEIKTLSLADPTTDLSADIPDGAVILAVQANIETTVTTGGGNGAKIGLGDGDVDPDLYGISADLIKNTKIDLIPDYAVLSGALSMEINLCQTGGGIATENPTAGAVRVRILYATLNSLDDA